MNSARFSQQVRYIVVTLSLLSLVAPAVSLIRRRYGGTAARRSAVAMVSVLALQQILVALVLRRKPTPQGLGPVDLMTLSRGAVSALLVGLIASGVRDRRGPAGWLAWCSAVYGAIVCDWLDGPLARRTRSSEAGAIFDLETDSWLTLWSGAAATVWGGLERYALLASLLRYPLFFDMVRRIGYVPATSGDPPWVRRSGIAQMALYLAALAPFGGRLTRKMTWIAQPAVAAAQIGSLVLLYRRKLRG